MITECFSDLELVMMAMRYHIRASWGLWATPIWPGRSWVVWAGVVADKSAVEHTLEPFGVPGELGGLGLTPTHRPDLVWW